MAADKSAILLWLGDLSATIILDEDDIIETNARIAAGSNLDADTFAYESLDIMRVIGESVSDAAGFDRIVIPDTMTAGNTFDAMTVLVSIGLSIAGCRVDWRARPLARMARTRISSAGDAALAVASSMGGDGADLYSWLSGVIEIACRLVSDLAANAIPIVRVQTGISMPSTVLAYQLYGDASRAGDLVDIAGSATPMVMPTAFDALAS